MSYHEFTLVLDGVSDTTPNLEDVLFEAGCDDALINFRDGAVYLDFHRQAASLQDAVLSAIQEIESSSLNARVVNVEPEYLVTISDIAKRLNVKKQTISLWVKGQRRASQMFPHPVMKLSGSSPLWRWSAVLEWQLKKDNVEEKFELDKAIFFETMSLALAKRNTSNKEIIDSLSQKIACSLKSKPASHRVCKAKAKSSR